jgi:predicted dienelactone hydrolase
MTAPTKPTWFKNGAVARDAALSRSDIPHPLVLLSHGTGGSTAGLDWLALRLAHRGFVALAVNHHGHTGADPYRAEGFVCLWERARDLSVLLDDRSWRKALDRPIDTQASVAGFSAGAYTAMLLVGARVNYSQFEPDNPIKSPFRGPREFPNLVDELPKLHENPVFRESWDRRRSDYRDKRFRTATVIAPGRSVLGFSLESLKAIQSPILIFGGDADTIAPPSECCGWLHNNVPESSMDILTGGIGHYTFLPEGTADGHKAAPDLFADKSGVERRDVHDHVGRLTADFAYRISF